MCVAWIVEVEGHALVMVGVKRASEDGSSFVSAEDFLDL